VQGGQAYTQLPESILLLNLAVSARETKQIEEENMGGSATQKTNKKTPPCNADK